MKKIDDIDIGSRLVDALKNNDNTASKESFTKALEITKAYAASGSATNFNTITKLFYDLFEMFETGRNPHNR